ncbi:MAG: hypothetical protein ACKOI2_14070 [Actinomycetota bacterium]
MMTVEESCAILGVSQEASRDDIVAARRRLARALHPDVGGSHTDMARVNEAFRILLAVRAERSTDRVVHGKVVPSDYVEDAGFVDVDLLRHRHGRVFRDAPSFVVNALPVEAFEVLLVAAAHLGEVVDEDPPYLLEVLIRDPGPLWCRFELFPDAGSTTVSLSCDVEPGYRVYSVEEIRDLWITTINGGSVSREPLP